MNLTAKEILKRGIILGAGEENIAQVGIDLNVIEVEDLSTEGFLPAKGKTQLPEYMPIPPTVNTDGRKVWRLTPGMYQIRFSQGCALPTDCSMDLYPRSSLARIGGNIISPKWDPGFCTDRMGSFLVVHRTLMIEVGARIAQACVILNPPVENPYNGQFQGK